MTGARRSNHVLQIPFADRGTLDHIEPRVGNECLEIARIDTTVAMEMGAQTAMRSG